MQKSLLSSALNLLPLVGPAVAALPEFKKLIADIGKTLDSDTDQDTLKAALAHAQEGSAEAHAELQKLVQENGA